MENKENIINELYRNMQLMKIDSNILNEQTFLKNLFRRSTKFLVDKSLKNFINGNSAIKNIISNPNSQKQINFRDAYNNWVSNPKNKDLQSDLILTYLDLDNVSILSKTEILEKGLNIGYNKLSNIIGQLLENPQNINNIIKSYNITDLKTIQILSEYLNIYKGHGSSKSKVLSANSINKLKKLAQDNTFWETFRLYKQTFFSILEGWRYGKEGLEVKLADKYRAYLEQIKTVTDNAEIENITLAYKKSIDKTYRSYLMIQDDLASEYFNTLKNTLGLQKNNQNALDFEQIINELKSSNLGEQYPGFKLTAQLQSVNSSNKYTEIWNSLNPGYNNLQRVKDLNYKVIPNWVRYLLNTNAGKTIRRTIVWGAFPNKKLLYTLIASNRKGLQNKQFRTLFSLYLQYSFLGALRSVLLTIYIPIAYAIYSLASSSFKGFLEKNNIDIPGVKIIPPLTDEERKLLDSDESAKDIVKVFLKEFLSYYYNTWASVGQIGDGGWDSKIYQIAYGIGIPNEVKAFDNSLVANIITGIASSDFGGPPNKDYNSFFRMVAGIFIPRLNKTQKDIEDRAKTEGERIQAGGTEIDVNNKTWSYSTTSLPNSKIVEINFPFTQTQKVVVNDKYNLDNTFFRNRNNKVTINVPNKITIYSIKVVDNNKTTHSFQKK